MQIPNEQMLTPQELVALADLVANSPARGSAQKRAHLDLEAKLLTLAKLTNKTPNDPPKGKK